MEVMVFKRLTLLTPSVWRIALVLSLCVPALARSQGDAETQRREAAAQFVMAQAMTLGILRQECRDWLAGGAEDVERVALAWWQGHRDQLDAANWVVFTTLQRHRATLAADAAIAAERQTLFASVAGSLALLRAMFNRELPTADSCRQAVRQYSAGPAGTGLLAKVPGYDRLAEFSEALRRVGLEPGYQRPEERSRTLDAQVSPTEDPMATLDAIEAAREKGNPKTILRGYETLAGRGDGKAAQALGFIQLQGQLDQKKDPAAAYRWFYRAWVLGEAEGLYALGVMWRDGIGVVANQKLALGAFLIARSMVGDTEPAGVRSAANALKLEKAMAPLAVAEIGCASWTAVHQALRSVLTPPPAASEAVPQLKPGLLRESFNIGPPNVACQ